MIFGEIVVSGFVCLFVFVCFLFCFGFFLEGRLLLWLLLYMLLLFFGGFFFVFVFVLGLLFFFRICDIPLRF